MFFYHFLNNHSITRVLCDTGLNKNTVGKIYTYARYAINFIDISERVFGLICEILDLADALYRLIFRGDNIGANIINTQNFETYIADDDVKDNSY